MVIQTCNNCGDIILTELLETGVAALCPACGPVYSVAKSVSDSSNFSQETRDAAKFVCGMFLLFAGAVYLDKLVASIRS